MPLAFEQVVGLIEIDDATNESPQHQPTDFSFDFTSLADDQPGNPAQRPRFTVRGTRPHIIHADLGQLTDDLRVELRRVRQQLRNRDF